MKNEEVRDIIQQAVEAGRIAGAREPKNILRATERRLRALPILRERILQNNEHLAEIRQYGPGSKDKSIVRFQRTGVRLSPEEIIEALIIDMQATIAADEHEVTIMEGVIARAEHDPYFRVVSMRYFDGKTDAEIAEAIPCDATTVWRNRTRILDNITVWLYGAAALYAK